MTPNPCALELTNFLASHCLLSWAAWSLPGKTWFHCWLSASPSGSKCMHSLFPVVFSVWFNGYTRTDDTSAWDLSFASWVIVLLTAVPGKGGCVCGGRGGGWLPGWRRTHPGFYKVNQWVLGRRFTPAQTWPGTLDSVEDGLSISTPYTEYY